MRIRGRKPTYNERKVLELNKLDTYQWLVTKNTHQFIEVINKETGTVKQITKTN